MSRMTCTRPLLCSRNFETNQTTTRIEPKTQSIFAKHLSQQDDLKKQSYPSRDVRFNDGQV
jgi:hypothetical protein